MSKSSLEQPVQQPERALPRTERAPTVVRPTDRGARMRTRVVATQAGSDGLPAWAKLAMAFGLPALGLFVVSMLLQSGAYRLNTDLFAERLIRAAIFALSGGTTVAMFVAVFGRGGAKLPLAVKLGALILATAALALGILFGLLW